MHAKTYEYVVHYLIALQQLSGNFILLSFWTNDIWFSFYNPYISFKDVNLFVMKYASKERDIEKLPGTPEWSKLKMKSNLEKLRPG